MTEEYFNKMKADLVETYKDVLCEESLADIDAAKNVGEFIAVLHKYAAFLRYKSVPKIDWVRKWFGEYKDLANKYGCYIDQIVTLKDPTCDSVLYGACKCQAMFTNSKIYSVTTQDESVLTILAYGAAFVKVRQKDASVVNVFHKDNTSIVKVRKV